MRRWGACRRHPRPVKGHATRALRCASGMPVGEVLVKGVPNAHSVARLAYPWSPLTPDRPWPAASLSPSRIHPAEPRRSRSPRRYSTPSEREHRISTRTPRLDNPLHPIPPVKVGQLSSPPVKVGQLMRIRTNSRELPDHRARARPTRQESHLSAAITHHVGARTTVTTAARAHTYCSSAQPLRERMSG